MAHECSRRNFLARSVLSAFWMPLMLTAQSTPKRPAGQKKTPPTPDAVAEKVKQIIAEQLGIDKAKIVPTARLMEDLGADSLDVVEVVMALEESFDINIDDQDCAKLHKVQEIIDYIRSRPKSPGRPGARTKGK